MMLARRNARAGLWLVGALALVVATASPGGAAPGDLDPTFDGDGRVTKDFGGNFDGATDVAVQEDGKIVVAGSALNWDYPAGAEFALGRFNLDGSLDISFAGDGMVTTDFAGRGAEARALAIQSDGKIVAAGSAGSDFGLARYNPDGSLDSTFDGDGKVTTDFASDQDSAWSVAVQEDGKIVAAGYRVQPGLTPSHRDAWDFALARYNPDGSLDTTFDGDGKVATDFAGGMDNGIGVAIQPDGKVVVAGYAEMPVGPSVSTTDFGVTRYRLDGSLDTTFDGDGKVTTEFSTEFDEHTGDFPKAVTVQQDGKIVVAGHTLIDYRVGDVVFGVFNLAMVRYNPDGSLDNGLAHDGTVTTDLVASGRALAIQRDGKIIVAGDASGSFALARYEAEGFLDTTFGGGDGVVTTEFAGMSGAAWGVGIQPDGKIVAAGQVGDGENSDFGLARYTVCRRTSMRSSTICPR